MKSVEFCYWLQGLFELAKPEALSATQTELVRRHLQMVFHHEIDQSYPRAEQGPLNSIHNDPNVNPAKITAGTDFNAYPPKMRC